MTFHSAGLRVEEIGDHSDQMLVEYCLRQPPSGAKDIRNVVRHLRLSCASKALIQDLRSFLVDLFGISCSNAGYCAAHRSDTDSQG
jgi:hypothetical protein